MKTKFVQKVVEIILFPLWRILDYFIPKEQSFWAFPVHHIKSDQFIENSRAVFELIKSDDSIKKIIFCRNSQNEFNIEGAKNTKLVNIKSFKALYFLTRCQVLFITNSIGMEYSWRWGTKLFSVLKINLKIHTAVNLSHGISLKKINAVANKNVKARLERVNYRTKEPLHYSGLIASSDVDSYAMGAMYYPVKYENIWLTGLPRNDFLLKDYIDLPQYLKNQIDNVKSIKSNKNLVVYAPTYRQTAAVKNSEYYQFSENEIASLKKILKKNNAILGVRLHYFRNNSELFNIEKFIDNELIFDIGHSLIPEIAPVIREADIVISDYSSVFTEALYIDKPIICFAYDFEHYKSQQNGLLYDFEMVFPGEIANNSFELFASLENEFKSLNENNKSEKYLNSQQFFYKYRDTNNSKRVVDLVKSKIIA